LLSPFLLYTESMKVLAKQKAVVVSKEGIRNIDAGDIVEVEDVLTSAEDIGEEVTETRSYKNNKNTLINNFGLPYYRKVDGKKILYKAARAGYKMTDMDYAIPREFLNKRKSYINDRMKQERGNGV